MNIAPSRSPPDRTDINAPSRLPVENIDSTNTVPIKHSGVTAWCDECWLNDFAEDLKSALDKGCFIDIDEDKVAQLEKEYESTNIIELVEDYFYHNKKILRIKYHQETPDIIDPKIIKEMTEKRNALDADYRKVKGLYEKAAS